MRHTAGVGVAAVACLGALLTGCTSARSSLGTSDDSCYLALPTASAAVGKHSHAHMVGLRRFTLTSLKQMAPHLYASLGTDVSASQAVCVVAFTGHFSADQVTKSKGKPAGPFAVVVSTTPANAVLGTVIFKRVPLHFGHTHAGP